MKKNISINLQGIIFHIEEDGYEVLSRYLAEVKAHFAAYRGHQDIVADIEGRLAEIFGTRLSPSKQVITLADVEAVTAQMGRVRDFATDDLDEEDAAPSVSLGAQGAGPGAAGSGPAPTPQPEAGPRRLYRDMAHRKIAGVAAGIAQYFRWNPLWVRIGLVVLAFVLPTVGRLDLLGEDLSHGRLHLGSWVVLVYVILWIALPKRYDAPAFVGEGANGSLGDVFSGTSLAGRRLFRDVDTAKIGGVAAGLAHYLNLDVVLVRVLLLAGLFAGGFTIILYLILWIVVPVATSVSEKMQMRGAAVTLSGIDDTLRSQSFEEGAPAGSRPMGTFLEGAARGARPVFSFFGTVVRWLVAALLIFLGASSLFSLASLLGAVLGAVPTDMVIHTDSTDAVQAVVRNIEPWGAVAAFLALGIPALSSILLGLRLILRRAPLGRTANLVLLGLWILGVVGTTAAAVRLARNFQVRSTQTVTRPLAAVAGPGVELAIRDRDDYLNNVRFDFAVVDSGAAPRAELAYSARGQNAALARQMALETTDYTIGQRDSTLTLDRGLTLKPDAPFRAQEMRLTLFLPLDKVYRLTPRFLEELNDDDFDNGYYPRDNQAHRARLTRDGKFRCLDCPAPPADYRDENNDRNGDENDNNNNGDDNDDNDDNSNIDLNINGERMRIKVGADGESGGVIVELPEARFDTSPSAYGSARRTLKDVADFSEIEASGDFRVLLRQGETAAVTAAGRQDDLDRMRLEVRDGRLLIRRRTQVNLFPSFTFNTKPVLVTVTVPKLRKLDLSGACRVDASGFRDTSEDISVEASGACQTRLDVRANKLSLDLSGASSAELNGRADELRVEGSGACKVQALAFATRRTVLDLSGVSQAKVNATDELVADLSGSSRANFSGDPKRIVKDLSGSSRLEQLK